MPCVFAAGKDVGLHESDGMLFSDPYLDRYTVRPSDSVGAGATWHGDRICL